MKLEIRWGLIISVLSFIWLCLEYGLGLHTRHLNMLPYVTVFSLLIPVICLWLAIKEKRNIVNRGSITFAGAFKTGAIISVIAAVLSLLSILLYFKVINPNFTSFMVEHMKAAALKNGTNVLEAEVQARRYFGLSNYLLQSFLSTLLIGLAISLIIAASIKKKIILWQD
ncbi:DUF4199 domain-containing protein [Solitalea koreensis]|uniref:DUF4199 domain-containing protein n=1 Tax=Solitalea koreensis TaxID=543615 RepID=A0A521EEX1_9SPHI|nr:DUF4199 domain-containing protein [Solitalea koreensis]SMO82473.1 Protein of unknown function [Solitalea koreensis]